MPIFTINGRPQPQPEARGVLERRFRLFIECVRRLADDPLAQPVAAGQPIGNGLGMEGLVAKIAPLFARERSMIRWVALRGAFADLFLTILHPTDAVVVLADLEKVMGVEWIPDARGGVHPGVVQPWRTTLPSEQQNAAAGLASSIFMHMADYERYSKLNIYEVNADPRCRISDAVALDSIVWSAIALLRLGIVQHFFFNQPEPDALPAPGWYVEPVFAKIERFWDGSDWTARCRRRDGNQFVETSVPLA